MTVNELREILKDFDGDLFVITKKTEILGNVGLVKSVRKDRFLCGPGEMSCVLITDEDAESEGKE